MTLFGKNSSFDKLLDKATSHLLLEPDWDSNINLCDMVRQGEVSAKYAIGALKKKLTHSNPHVVIYSLNLLEAMAKNCGPIIHEEIATPDFMNQMKNLVKEKDAVKSKVLELIQLWAHAFGHQSKYIAVQNTFNALKSAGNTFPILIESDAMFASENAPEWQDSDVCLRCKIPFSTLKRKVSLLDKITRSTNVKHHCRNCGNIFCDECSSKRSNIPKYGIEKDVRVCDLCFDQIKRGNSGVRSLPVKKGGRVQFNNDVAVRSFQSEKKDFDNDLMRVQKENELQLQEKEELELALALSASEAESKENNRSVRTVEQHIPNNQTGFNSLYSTLDTSEMDPELARYLNRNYWENKAFGNTIAKTPQPSAPIMPSSTNKFSQSKIDKESTISSPKNKLLTGPILPQEKNTDQEEFLSALKCSIEIFINRMRSNQQRGRSIAHDSAVQTLFLTLNAMQPQLLQYINEQDDKRNFFETLQDKLAQLRESREALDALREEHREKRRREEDEATRIRQIQLMQKLEIMRQKKQEFLDYQRQLAVDRMQQQERDMATRLAQQKQTMQMRQYQQQYPYSMQQTLNVSDLATIQPVNMPGVHLDSFGYPMVSQYGPPQNIDYYNMQNLNQNLMHIAHSPDATPNQMSYSIHAVSNNPVNLSNQPIPNMYPVIPQTDPGWEQNSPSDTSNVKQLENDIQQNREKKEDHLISFD